MATVVKSWRDMGKLGYGSGGNADSPWTRQGIFVQSSTGRSDRGVDYGGPGINPAKRPKIENKGLKTVHEFLEANSLCIHCHMLKDGHERLMESLRQ